MSWRDSLQRGSFRGVPFEIDSASKRAGRKAVTHEYPQSDRNETEDLGRGPRRFSLELFVIGPDYMSGRDALEAALEAGGVGELVHPYRGRLQVSLDGDYSCTESSREGGMATFSVSFVLDDGITRPGTSVDTQAASAAAAALAKGASTDQLADSYAINTAAERSFSLDVLTDSLKPVAQLIRTVQSTASSTQLQLIAALLDPIAGARNVLGDVVDLPGDLGSMVHGLLGNIGNAADLTTLFERSPKVRVTGDGAKANQTAFNNLFRAGVAVRQAELTAQTSYASYDEAVAAQALVTAQLDAVAYVADDATFAALQDLRAAVSADLQARGANLARITSYTPGESLPALVIAHRLYGPAGVIGQAEDIVARNKLVHPGFARGGVALEVLTP